MSNTIKKKVEWLNNGEFIIATSATISNKIKLLRIKDWKEFTF